MIPSTPVPGTPMSVRFPNRSPYSRLEDILLLAFGEEDFPDFVDDRFLREQLPAAAKTEVALCL